MDATSLLIAQQPESEIPVGSLLVTLGFLLVSAVWVYIDAKSIGARKGLVGGIANNSPLVWAVGTVLMWIVVVPIYLFNRSKILHAAEVVDRRSVPQSCAPAPRRDGRGRDGTRQPRPRRPTGHRRDWARPATRVPLRLHHPGGGLWTRSTATNAGGTGRNGPSTGLRRAIHPALERQEHAGGGTGRRRPARASGRRRPGSGSRSAPAVREPRRRTSA